MRKSKIIEDFIRNLIIEHNGFIEIKRNELAEKFQVVPSQINYVISTRFSPERGYTVESRRGSGGYIRIQIINHCEQNYIMHSLNIIGKSLTFDDARFFIQNFLDYQLINQGTAQLIIAAIADANLLTIPQPIRDNTRAKIFKNILLNL